MHEKSTEEFNIFQKTKPWASVREYFSPSRSGLFFQFRLETEKDNKTS